MEDIQLRHRLTDRRQVVWSGQVWPDDVKEARWSQPEGLNYQKATQLMCRSATNTYVGSGRSREDRWMVRTTDKLDNREVWGRRRLVWRAARRHNPALNTRRLESTTPDRSSWDTAAHTDQVQDAGRWGTPGTHPAQDLQDLRPLVEDRSLNETKTAPQRPDGELFHVQCKKKKIK